jgi:glycyl-tRNA synthetase beta chain
MGGYYAGFDGEDREVALAISQHYQPNSMEGPIPAACVSQVLSLADRLDNLAAFFHVGIVPTGSEDPFALRRHATAIVRILLEGHVTVDLGEAVREARAIVEAAGIKAAPTQGDAQKRLIDFLFERVRHYVRMKQGLRDDVINAVLTVTDRQSFELRDLMAKMKALESVTTKPEFDPLIVGFKRAHRLVEKEQWDRKSVNLAQFEHTSESALYHATVKERENMMSAMNSGDYGQALDSLVRLKPAIDTFFTAVMVNADDPAVRSNRLSLLQEVDDFFNSFADFSQIVVQGG